MDANDRLSSDDEKKRYSFHRNSIDDNGYVDFLNRVIEPSLRYIAIGMNGLDFGCGPNPVLAQILESKGIDCSYYDPFFFPECDTNAKYDFIFATECFEHFFSPAKEIENICKLLKNNALLCVMTEMYSSVDDFGEWYYKNDPTHVCFYGGNTFDYICSNFGFTELHNDNHRVIILRKL